MSTTHKFFVLLTLALLLLGGGCQAEIGPPEEATLAPAAPTVASADVAVVPSATPLAPASAETAPATAPPELTAMAAGPERVEANIEGVSFTYPEELAEEITVETAPATELAPDDWQMRFLAQPASTHLMFGGYPVSRDYQQAHIALLPVEAATALTLRAEQRVEQLQALLAEQPAPPVALKELPFLPLNNAAQIIHARGATLSFSDGSGLRYLTTYAQANVPIANDSLIYTYQGITSDGRFYVSASFPVESDALPHDMAAAQAEGWDASLYALDELAYEEYLSGQRALLESLQNGDFTPSLDTLDAVMQSLDLSGYQGPAAEPWAAEVEPGPDQVLDDFLERYTVAGGFWADAYQADTALHPDYVARLEARRNEWESQGADLNQYDPILMTANLRGGGEFAFPLVEVGAPWIEEDGARVTVERFAYEGGTVLPLIVTMRWEEAAGAWQISDTSTILSHPQREITAAEEVVEAVFGPGLAARPGMESVGLQNLALPTDARSDLCTQDCPWGFVIDGAFPTGASDSAGNPVYDVVLYSSFSADPHLVRVEPRGDGYAVTEQVKVLTPVERARAFYTWYLAEAAVSGETRWASRQPQLARMNDFRIFVSERFFREANQRMVTEDPYLPSGRVPQQFRVEEGPDENTALVHLDHGDSATTLLLTFVDEMGRLVIENIEPAP